jgi:hypothetical protein
MNLVYHFLHARNTHTLEPGTVLFKEDDPVGPMYVLLEGAARVVIADHVVEMAGVPGARDRAARVRPPGAREARVRAPCDEGARLPAAPRSNRGQLQNAASQSRINDLPSAFVRFSGH